MDHAKDRSVVIEGLVGTQRAIIRICSIGALAASARNHSLRVVEGDDEGLKNPDVDTQMVEGNGTPSRKSLA